jgi:hypothetical protein
MSRAALALAAALLLSACGDSGEPAAEADEAPALGASGTRLPPQVADFPVLASKDCAEVVQFYLEALGGREWDKAALVWDDPVVDAARLAAVFGAYKVPQVEWTEPFVEGAAGSLYCTVSGKLTDAGDPAKILLEGTLLLRRANDVPGATSDQLRWTLRSSTFVESLERSSRG